MIRKRRKRIGFTLMEVAVAAVLIAVLAAATVPTLSEFTANRDAATTANTLSQIGQGIFAFKSGVIATSSGSVATYPRFISQLTNLITSTAGSPNASKFNSCLGVHTANAVSTWSTTAPFVTFNIPVGGLLTPLGVIQDSMGRNPNTATVGRLEIRMNVDSMDAVRLDRVIDGGDGATAGTLRITFTGTGVNTRRADLTYWVPVANKC